MDFEKKLNLILESNPKYEPTVLWPGTIDRMLAEYSSRYQLVTDDTIYISLSTEDSPPDAHDMSDFIQTAGKMGNGKFTTYRILHAIDLLFEEPYIAAIRSKLDRSELNEFANQLRTALDDRGAPRYLSPMSTSTPNSDNPLDDYQDQFGGDSDLVLVLSKD